MFCSNCGSEVKEEEKFCGECGYPINYCKENKDSSGVQKKKSPIITIMVIFLIFALAAFAIGGYKLSSYKSMISELEAKNSDLEQQIEEKDKQLNDILNEQKDLESSLIEYDSDIRTFLGLVGDGAAEAETIGARIMKVWNNSIARVSDAETDKYTKDPNTGVFYDDFNDALYSLQEDVSFSESNEKIYNNQLEVVKAMNRLRNPPEGQEAVYEAITECYNDYLNLTQLVLTMQGSYNSFSADYNEYDSDLYKSIMTLATYISQ